MSNTDIPIKDDTITSESVESGLPDKISQSVNDTKLLEFNWGDALTPKSSIQITSARPTRLIVLAGDVGSGKTTILSSLYELIQDGPIGPFVFGGSRTLIEYERISHPSRIASDRQTAKTVRTIRTSDYRLLHTSFFNKKNGLWTDLLFTDITGEIFSEISDSTKESQHHPVLLRCDHFVVLIDGEKLSNPLSRTRAIYDVEMILKRLLDAEILHEQSYVNVVFTKMDLVAAVKTEQPELLKFIKDSKKLKILNPFISRVKDLTIHDIAARPKPEYIKYYKAGHGLSDLLTEWINYYPNSRLSMKNALGTINPSRYRAIDRFGCPEK